MQNRVVTIGFRLTVALLGVCAVAACGGRSITVEGAGGSASTGAGASFGGSGARGGSTAQGGSTACTGSCPLVTCAANETPVTPAGACCPLCMPIACPPCPLPVCSAGYHPEVPDGQCCSVCAPDPVDQACLAEQANYASLSGQMIKKFGSLPCMSDADCTVVTLINPCAAACQSVAVLSSVSESLVNLLSQTAADVCGSCPPPPELKCSTPPPHCYSGLCEIEVLPK